MIKKIFKHELRCLWRDYTAAAAVLIFIVALFGAYNGASYATARVAANNLALAADEKTFADLKIEARQIETGEKPLPAFGSAVKSSSIGLFFPRTAALFPAAFAFTAIGQSDVYPAFFKVSGRRADDFLDAHELENPTNLLVGRFDLAFVIVFLVPLFAFGLSYNLLSGERESGTLDILVAQGARMPVLILGKLLARAAVLLTPLFLAAFIATLLWANIGGETISFFLVLTKFGVWCTMVVLYTAFWFGVASLVNLYGKSSASNAFTLAAVWIALVMLAPTFINLVAQTIYPMPSRLELITFSREMQLEKRKPVELLEEYYRENPEARPVGKDLTKYDFPLYYTAIQRKQNNLVKPVLERYDAALERQQTFVRAASIASPPLVAHEMLNDLAGTGYARQREFLRQVAAFHQTHKDFFEPLAFRDAKLSSTDYDRMPRFAFQEEADASLLTRVFIALSFLSLINTVAVFLIWKRSAIYKLIPA